MRKNFETVKEKAKIAAATVATTAMMATPVFAEGTTDVSTTLTNSLNTVKGDVLSYVAVILPVGLGIFGAIWGIKKAIAFFRSIAK